MDKLKAFFLEKDLPYMYWDIKTETSTHLIDSHTVIDFILHAPCKTQNQIYETLMLIDFKNASVLDYLKHIAKGIAFLQEQNRNA